MESEKYSGFKKKLEFEKIWVEKKFRFQKFMVRKKIRIQKNLESKKIRFRKISESGVRKNLGPKKVGPRLVKQEKCTLITW